MPPIEDATAAQRVRGWLDVRKANKLADMWGDRLEVSYESAELRISDIEEILAERERLTAPPTDDEREALAFLLFVDETGSEWQEESFLRQVWTRHPDEHSVKVLYRNRADAILAAGFRRQGPITDAQLLAALNAYDPRSATENLDDYAEEHQADMRAALEASRDES